MTTHALTDAPLRSHPTPTRARDDSSGADTAAPSGRRPPAGPRADLVGLPDDRGVALTVPLEVYAHLTELQAARQRQLDALPTTSTDAVSAAYRGTLERILEEVRAARHRVSAGSYGLCTGCRGVIPLQRLQLRPWAARCAGCPEHDRP
jgi:RNA polymerase-binding transcription factor DksA